MQLQRSETRPPFALRLAKRLALLGPAFIVGATQFGPGNITASSSVGASHGYQLIWLIVISTVFMLVYTDMSVRIGLSSPESAIQAFKRYGPVQNVVGSVTAVGIALTGFLFNIGSVLGAALGLSLLFPGDLRMWSIVVGIAALALVLVRNYYASLEKLMVTLVGAMILLFAVTSIATKPDWVGVGAGFIPSLPGYDWTLIVALLGTNFSVTSSLYASYATRQKGMTKDRYRDITLTDTIAGVIAPAIMTILIVIAAANVLMPQGKSVESGADMANVLQSAVGPWAVGVFGLGIFAGGFTSVMGNATGGSFLIADAFGWGASLNAKKTKTVVASLIIVPTIVAATFTDFPIQTIVTANALTILVVPLTGLVMILIANDRTRMAGLKNKAWQNVLAVLGWLALAAGVVQLIRELFFS